MAAATRGSPSQGGAQLDQVFVMSHGIIVIGQQNGRPVAWFADAEPR